MQHNKKSQMKQPQTRGASGGGRSVQSIEVADEGGVVSLKVRLVAYMHEEDGGYAVYCPALDVASQGDTVDEAKKNIAEATQCFLKGCHKMGTLKKVLLESGFLLADKKQARRERTKASAEHPPRWFPFSAHLMPVADYRRVRHAA